MGFKTNGNIISNFRVSNPLNDTEYDLGMHRLQVQKDQASETNRKSHFRYGHISYARYNANIQKILDEYEKAKSQLQNDRHEAEIIATSLYDGTDSISTAVRETLEMLDRYEDGILGINLEIKDDVTESMRNITDAVKKSLDSLNEQLNNTNDLMVQLNATKNSVELNDENMQNMAGKFEESLISLNHTNSLIIKKE